MTVALSTLIQILLVGAYFSLRSSWPVLQRTPGERQLGGLVEVALREGFHQPFLLVCLASVSLWASVYLLHKYVTPETSHPFLLIPLSAVVFTLLAAVLVLLALCAFMAGLAYLLVAGISAH